MCPLHPDFCDTTVHAIDNAKKQITETIEGFFDGLFFSGKAGKGKAPKKSKKTGGNQSSSVDDILEEFEHEDNQ